MKIKALTTVLLFFTSLSSNAYFDNPNIYPLGEKEAFMANTGVALTGSTGGVLFNPAGLATIENSKVSLSANSYLSIKTNYAPLDVVDSTNLDLSTDGVIAVPSSLVSVQKIEKWTLAFSVLVPELTQLNDMSTHETTNFATQMILSVRSQFLLIGLSGATQHVSGYDYGFGCFLGTVNGTSNRSVVAEPKTGSGFAQTGYTSDSITLDVTGLLCNGGVQKNYNDRIRWGVNVRLPFIQTSGSAKVFTYQQSASGGSSTNSGIQKVSVDYHIPLDVSAGASYKLKENLQLYGDLSYQFSQNYKPTRLSSSNVETNATLRWNLGASYFIDKNYKFYGGFAYNPGTSVLNSAGDLKEDFTILTLGGEWVQKITTTGVGLLVGNTSGESVLSNGQKGSVKTNIFGILISGGFSF